MKDILFTVDKIEFINDKNFKMVIRAPEKLPHIHCGQFLHLEVPTGGILLRRPICISNYDDYCITTYIVIVGKGTKELSKLKPGDKLRAILPIGNGYILEENHKKVVLIGGGVGIAPLITVPKSYPNVEYFTYLGFGTKSMVMMQDDFKAVSKELTVCTDDGSYGKKGFPTDYLDADISRILPDVILTCGTTPMMKAVAAVSLKHNIKAYMSGESHMGCGVGACLVCTCAVKQPDGSIKNKRACVDGPVFSLDEIIL